MSDRKRALICFPHGLGDVIQATPAMRTLYEQGYILDMMVRSSVIDSHLLDNCPYIGKLIRVRTDTTKEGWKKYHIPMCKRLNVDYDKAITCTLLSAYKHRQHHIAKEFGVKPASYKLEVWINQESVIEAQRCVRMSAPRGRFVHVHTQTEVHKKYWWDSQAHVRKQYPGMLIMDSGFNGNLHKRCDNINTTFAIMKRATHLVLSLSVMAAAADALELPIDLLNCVDADNACLPLNRKLIKQYRIDGKIK